MIEREYTIKKFLRKIILFIGFFSLGLGIVGVFLPLLPTTPFLLLSVVCFARSSKKAHKNLLENKWFGPYIKNYMGGKGIPLREKILLITLLWITICFSSLFLIPNTNIKFLLLVIAMVVTLHILTINRS
ncbi:MAG: YbaN family protein [Methanobacterium sp.]